MSEINFEHFTKVNIHVGTIIHAEMNKKAIKPSYVITIDFGKLGIKTSSAQLTECYKPEDLINKQIIAVTNFPVKRIAGVKSEVLILACISDTHGIVLLRPDFDVPDGSKIA